MLSVEAMNEFKKKLNSDFVTSFLGESLEKIIPLDNFNNLNSFLGSLIFINNVKFKQDFFNILVEDSEKNKILFCKIFYDDTLRKIISFYPNTKYSLLAKVNTEILNDREFRDVSNNTLKLYHYGDAYKIPLMKKKKANKSIEGSCGGLSLFKKECGGGKLSLVEE